MTREELSRTEMLLGTAAVEKLAGSRVAVFGIGGVGGYVVEALARSGVGALDLIDPDRIAPSNLNRQIIALHSTVGEFKVDVARERVLDINPDATVTTYKTFFTPETAGEFDFSAYDCVVDAIDTVTGKIELAVRCRDAGTPLISSMGTGNKTDPSALRAADISKTSVCPLARVMRRELRKRGITHLRVVYSEEEPLVPQDVESAEEPSPGRRQTPGSCAFVPPAAGLIIAGEVIGILINRK
ncbi:MAG: tRNA threonylcarbamoyladenosine dehydratase [Clostridia bacterium]|nr:tRNA threonylcarbamoyladenosine dehydratase [Clostridia bacterium]